MLQDPHVTTAVPGMKDMAMLKEDLSVMGMKLTQADRRILNLYGNSIDPYYCQLCARCEETCPEGVAISVINRCLMYAEAYGEPELAEATYKEIPIRAAAPTCLSCSSCVARCVRGIDIEAKMAQARHLFA